MRSRAKRAVLLATTLLIVSGCLHQSEETSIPPLSAAGEGVDPGLGPEAQPLSSGPGYKGSPSFSPQGDRIAYTVDGYVVDRPVETGDARRWTTKDFVAEDAEWTSEDSLAIFGATSGPVKGASRSVYTARSGEGSLGVKEVATHVLAMSPGSEDLIVALQTGAYKSQLAMLGDNGAVDRRRASFELYVFDLGAGTQRRIARLNKGLEVFGAPQWTRKGICYVVGKKEEPGEGDAEPLYDLYTILPDSGVPEPTPGVGKDFVASSIRVSPDREHLAIIGRLNPKATINLYVLDLAAQDLEVLTVNEDMEIKTGPDDLAWSPGGKSIAIVARGVLPERPSVRAAPKETLLEDFYNLYEVPVGSPETGR
jgi:WD40-like Beta Propeller Repeat